MAVIIQNISGDVGLQYGEGKQLYILKINERILTSVEHVYEDGLAVLLHRAADAFETRSADKIREEGI